MTMLLNKNSFKKITAVVLVFLIGLHPVLSHAESYVSPMGVTEFEPDQKSLIEQQIEEGWVDKDYFKKHERVLPKKDRLLFKLIDSSGDPRLIRAVIVQLYKLNYDPLVIASILDKLKDDPYFFTRKRYKGLTDVLLNVLRYVKITNLIFIVIFASLMFISGLYLVTPYLIVIGFALIIDSIYRVSDYVIYHLVFRDQWNERIEHIHNYLQELYFIPGRIFIDKYWVNHIDKASDIYFVQKGYFWKYLKFTMSITALIIILSVPVYMTLGLIMPIVIYMTCYGGMHICLGLYFMWPHFNKMINALLDLEKAIYDDDLISGKILNHFTRNQQNMIMLAKEYFPKNNSFNWD
ncbi:MAG: hypothetical protein GF384_07190, partial [Elusimicrobia bacterium]|nr:hypothetical protein [Elusimicrobiota bacterium]